MVRGPEKGTNVVLVTFCGIVICGILIGGLGHAGFKIAEFVSDSDPLAMHNGLTAGRALGFFVFLVGGVALALNHIDKSGRQ